MLKVADFFFGFLMLMILVTEMALLYRYGQETLLRVHVGDPETSAMQENKSKFVHKIRDAYGGRETAIISDGSDTCGQWCDIPMPAVSYFRFEPPSNLTAWKTAQLQAASGEQVLLKSVRRVLKTPADFLDGDLQFRKFHDLSDIFLDRNTGFTELTWQDNPATIPPGSQRKFAAYPWEGLERSGVVPRGYGGFRQAQRAPIVQVGYHAFARVANDSAYFAGEHLGEAPVEIEQLLATWAATKDLINTPFILLHGANENWGLFSTHFPNRTIDWATCCDQYPAVQALLDHPLTICVLTNQHHNLTHPKLITLPRGLPTFLPNRRKRLFDLMRQHEITTTKSTLVFASHSSWKHRPHISACIAEKFRHEPDAISVNQYKARETAGARMGEEAYYSSIATARMSIALPGLGYETFRLWETMTLGTVPVLEKGIGLDKTLWRLPALLVEDFDEVTPGLLRAAYVEALYRTNAGQFEFERLTQSFWWAFVMNVSTSISQDAISAKFPPEAEDGGFARPLVPYSCGEGGQRCGPGTKRTPRSSCGGKPSKLV